MRKSTILMALTVLGLILLPLVVRARDLSTVRRKEALKGLDGVEVVVTLHGFSAQLGLEREAIARLMAEVLESKGVPVLSRESNPDRMVGVLAVRLSVVPQMLMVGPDTGVPIFLASLDTGLGLSVAAPNLTEPTFAIVWSTGGMAAIGPNQLSAIGHGLIEQALEFAADFRAANGISTQKPIKPSKEELTI